MNLLVYSKTLEPSLSCVLCGRNRSGRLKNCGLQPCSGLKSTLQNLAVLLYILVKYRL